MSGICYPVRPGGGGSMGGGVGRSELRNTLNCIKRFRENVIVNTLTLILLLLDSLHVIIM